MSLADSLGKLSRSITGSRRDGDGRITVMRIIDRLNIGGPAIHAVVTSRGLDRTRFRTVLVIGSIEASEGDMAYLLEEAGVEQVVSIPTLGREMRPLRDLKTAWQLLRVMLRERPQVVHTHKAKAGAIGRAAAILFRVPVRVHTFHGHVLRGYFGPTKSRMYQLLERWLARGTSQLVVPSPRLADELSGEFRVAPRDRFDVVPLGFDLDPFAGAERHRGELRRQLGVADGVRLVAIVGRMVPVKDHATFIAAASLLAERRADVQFVFVGGGELEAKIKADVESRGLAGRCHLLGWRKDSGSHLCRPGCGRSVIGQRGHAGVVDRGDDRRDPGGVHGRGRRARCASARRTWRAGAGRRRARPGRGHRTGAGPRSASPGGRLPQGGGGRVRCRPPVPAAGGALRPLAREREQLSN